MVDPTASIWDVTRLILGNAGSEARKIAAEHGYTAAEIAEMLPIFLDNLRIDFALAGKLNVPLPAPRPAPGESPEAFVERYLSSLGGAVGVDVVPYEALGARTPDPAGAAGADPAHPSAEQNGSPPDAAPAFGTGREAGAGDAEPTSGLDGPGPQAGRTQAAEPTDAETPNLAGEADDTFDRDLLDESARFSVDEAGEVSETDFQFD